MKTQKPKMYDLERFLMVFILGLTIGSIITFEVISWFVKNFSIRCIN